MEHVDPRAVYANFENVYVLHYHEAANRNLMERARKVHLII